MPDEWCVMRPDLPDEPHRGPMSETDARRWVEQANKDGVPGGMFYVAKREVGPWQKA